MKGQKFIPLLVVAAGLLAYHNSFTGSFFHDDFGSITENPTIQHLWPIWQTLSPPQRGGLTVESRPLINLSLAINYAVGGYEVWGYHAFNLAVHILAGLTLLGIVRRTLLRMPRTAVNSKVGTRSTASIWPRRSAALPDAAGLLALAVAVLWTVHPLQTESVTYIVQRAESMMGLFYLLTLYCFIRGAESERKGLWYGLSITACALGMTSKEVMVTAPVMVMLYDRAFLSSSFQEAWGRRWRLYLALASTWIPLGILLASRQVPTTLANAQHVGLRWWQYLVTEPGVILYYLRLSAWPHPLRFDTYGWPIAKTCSSILPPALAVAVLLGATVWAWRKTPAWGFVGVWFFLILAPSSSFIPLLSPIYEHRMYLSLAALVTLVVLGLYSVAGRYSLVVFAVAAAGLGFMTWRQNQMYQRNPHFRMGYALLRAGQAQEAVAEFEQALPVMPNDPWLHFNLAAALFHSGKIPEAIEQYQQVLRLAPDLSAANHNLGRALAELGRFPEAIEQYEQALRIKTDDEAVRNNLGMALLKLGRIQEAIAQYQQAIRINPNFAEAYYSLGFASEQLGQLPEAVSHYEEALRIKPDFAEAHNRLGLTLVKLDKVPEAMAHWEQALRINPDYADPHNNLGTALAQLGRFQEAVDHWQQALQINPDFPEALFNLGSVAELAGKTNDAVQYFERALELKPDYAAAKNALARLRAGP